LLWLAAARSLQLNGWNERQQISWICRDVWCSLA
jgi:hypothetical protein